MKTILFLTATCLLNISAFAHGRTSIQVTYTKTDVTCAGQNNGSITLSVSGGKEPYTYTWKNGESTTELKNLRGGNYSVVVKDAEGKSVKQLITIEEPSPLGFYYKSTELSRVDEFNALMDISIFGGSPWEIENTEDYFVRLNGKSYYETPENLKDGLYDFSIEDAKGCTFSLKVNLHIELVKSVTEAESIVRVTDNSQNSFGSINMFVIHHDLLNSSMLENFNSSTAFEQTSR